MGKLILTLDDSNVIKTNIELILEKAGCENVHAYDGQEGVTLAKEISDKQERISLVLCDYNMPNMNGLEFLKWFKAQPDFKFVPVVMITTESEINLMQSAKVSGAAGWLIKPFEEEQLLDIIRKFAK